MTIIEGQRMRCDEPGCTAEADASSGDALAEAYKQGWIGYWVSAPEVGVRHHCGAHPVLTVDEEIAALTTPVRPLPRSRRTRRGKR